MRLISTGVWGSLEAPQVRRAFCFRLSKNERNELNELLDKAKARLNKDKKKDDYVITKNEILFEAIKIGLPKVFKK